MNCLSVRDVGGHNEWFLGEYIYVYAERLSSERRRTHRDRRACYTRLEI